METLTHVLPQILFVLGLGFLVANVRAGLELVRWARRRPSALVTWPARRPAYYGLSLAIGVALGLLLLFKMFLQPRVSVALFGELMMFAYYGYAVPLTARIGRGLYADGIWADSGFMKYTDIGGLSWKGEESQTLVVISRLRTLARPLQVPGTALGEVRRLLREKIANHAIEFEGGPGLHLGGRDVRDSV